MSVLLELQNVRYRYPGRQVDALRGLSVQIESGSVLFVLGPNGSGKTTLFRTMLAQLRPQQGRVRYDGVDPLSLSARQLARIVSYIQQQQATTFDYTVLDTVLMGRTPYLSRFGGAPDAEDERLAREAISALGIDDLADRGIAQISGGQRQLVMIARALCQQSAVVVMDEPTASLDFANQHRVLRQARRLARRGVLVVIASHNPADAMEYADSVLLMKEGDVIRHAATEEIGAVDLAALYGIDVIVADVPGTGRRVCLAADDTPNSHDNSDNNSSDNAANGAGDDDGGSRGQSMAAV